MYLKNHSFLEELATSTNCGNACLWRWFTWLLVKGHEWQGSCRQVKLSPGFCLCTRRSVAQEGAPVVVEVSKQLAQEASLYSSELHLFRHTSFSTHSHSISHTLTQQDPCLPPYIRWDPAPSASSSPLSLLLPWQSETCTTNELVSFTMVARTYFMYYLKLICLLCWASVT